MGGARKYDEIIYSLIKKHGECTFSEIKEHSLKDYNLEICDSTLSRNLKFLKYTRESISLAYSRKKKVRVYNLTKQRHNAKLEKALRDSVDETNPVYSPPATPWITPIFKLGSEAGRNKIMGLLPPAIEQFRIQLEEIISDLDTEKRSKLLTLLGRLIWCGNLESIERNRKFLNKMETQGRTKNDDFQKHLTKLESCQNFEQLIIYLRESNQQAQIKILTREYFLSSYHKLHDYQWLLLENVLPLLSFENIDIVLGSLDDNVTVLKQSDSKELFANFVNEILGINFILIVAVGCEKIDGLLWEWVQESFDRWMKKLNAGDYDGFDWIFERGIKNLAMFMRYLKPKKERTKKHTVNNFFKNTGVLRPLETSPIPWENLVNGKGGRIDRENLLLCKGTLWDLLYLYEHHPRGKEYGFYKEISEAINKRCIERLKETI